ncbi:MAG: protoheme IX farnesyltransferase [Candidatus Marinimicrobia bacterium]|nr:protoheme IX farnesyltransferase [Candidatus Neomarinimicrobiota bacterium]
MRRRPPKAQSLLGAYIELTKPNITFLILVSTALGFYLGAGNLDKLREFLLTLIGSGLVSSGAGALNHYAEKETDQLMNRTKSRPIPTGMVDEEMALVFGIFLILSGTLILYSFINQFTAILGLITALLYLFIYTPLKKLTWLNTSIGAIPGAIPPLGGWVAATGSLAPEAWILFAILFLWQHPHFYAIAFMCKEDYDKANLAMLPVLESDGKRTNRQIIWHSLLLIPVSVVPSYIGILGISYFWGALILSLAYFISGFPLVKNYSLENAKLLLKTSVIYLPALFAMIILDKII